MTASIATLRDALQTRLDTINGLSAYDVQGGQERMPCAIVWPAAVERMSAAGGRRYSFVIEVWAPLSAGLAKAQDALDSYLDPRASTAIEAAIYADDSLGGIADSTLVDGFEGYGFGRLNSKDVNAIVARIPVEVLVS